MPTLHSDILYAIVKEVTAAGGSAASRDILSSLSLTCRTLRETCLPILFAQVHWPHQNKNDEESGLYFFPSTLWPYFKHFQLLWPDEWPETSPPRWGNKYYQGGDYHPGPRHVDKLVAALPNMPVLTSFYVNCPFYPPNSILHALVESRSLRSLSINDTPLCISRVPKIPPTFQLDRLSLVPVAQALRVGEGPYDAKFSQVTYYVREYRRRYKNDSLAPMAARSFLFSVGKPASLRHVELDTLVLTGHAPRPKAHTELLDVLARMPALRELRLLFARTKGDCVFRILPPGGGPSEKDNSPALLAQIKHLAMSNACSLDGVFHHTLYLERLAICAIIDQPRVPIALSRSDIDNILSDFSIAGSSAHLRHFRIMIEDKVNPDLCHAISAHCPKLEALEIELCGYHDGKSIYAWDEFAEAFSSLHHLRDLRICIQFPEFDEVDQLEPWRDARRECALYLASRIPTLQRVGFEYRKRTGTHRYEDNWLEYDIQRYGRAIELFDLVPAWYPFPEVWQPVSVAT
ncbi:hypothetical protein BD779DRAFT_1612695 [Infundibulicybe gibba]|nr:hypothetical protein BD779DRAFT_1612695 [Infundibulicybe gibba]